MKKIQILSLFVLATSVLFAGIGDVKLKGPLGERLEAMIANHVVARDVDYITAPFFEKTERQWRWQTEFWGKWMHSAMPYLEYTGCEKLRSSVERGIKRIISTQEPSGYIGNYPDDRRCGEGWDVWGMKYTMLGLIHHYDGTKDMKSFTPVRVPCDAMWMTFSAVLDIGIHHANPEGALPSAVFFCDFASAGNTWKRDDCYRTWFPVELSPFK